MKKKIIIVSILIVLIIVLLLIPKDVYQKIFKKTPDVDTPQTDNLVYQTMYVKNSSQYLVGVKVGIKAYEEDEVSQKWDLLTKDAALIPNGYSSPIAQTTTLYSHSIEDSVLTLNVNEDFLNSEGRLAIECLAWNFCNNSVKEVVVKIGDQVVNEVSNYYFNKISVDNGVNLTYETLDLFEAEIVTVIFHQNEIIKPVTFFYKPNLNEYEFVLKKIFNCDSELAEVFNESCSYEIKTNELIVSLNFDTQLSDDVVQMLNDTFKIQDVIKKVTINGTQDVLLKIDYDEE